MVEKERLGTGVVWFGPAEPPRMIRGIPLLHSRANLLNVRKVTMMLIAKEKQKKISNIELTVIILGLFLGLAILFLPLN